MSSIENVEEFKELISTTFFCGTSIFDRTQFNIPEIEEYCRTQENCYWLDGEAIVSQVLSRYSKRSWANEIRVLCENLVFVMAGRKAPKDYQRPYHFDLIKPVFRRNKTTAVVLKNAQELYPKTLEIFASFGKDLDDLDHQMYEEDGQIHMTHPVHAYFVIITERKARRSKWLKDYTNITGVSFFR